MCITSLQCGRQIAQLKNEYEETKKTLEEEASKLRRVSIHSHLGSHSLDPLVNDVKLLHPLCCTLHIINTFQYRCMGGIS